MSLLYKVKRSVGKCEKDVDYVGELTVRQLNPPDECDGTVGGGHIDSNYMARYSSQELRYSQLRDSELQPVITWLNGESPTGNDLQLQGNGTRMLRSGPHTGWHLVLSLGGGGWFYHT